MEGGWSRKFCLVLLRESRGGQDLPEVCDTILGRKRMRLTGEIPVPLLSIACAIRQGKRISLLPACTATSWLRKSRQSPA